MVSCALMRRVVLLWKRMKRIGTQFFGVGDARHGAESRMKGLGSRGIEFFGVALN